MVRSDLPMGYYSRKIRPKLFSQGRLSLCQEVSPPDEPPLMKERPCAALTGDGCHDIEISSFGNIGHVLDAVSTCVNHDCPVNTQEHQIW
jgi:hypothetical protein